MSRTYAKGRYAMGECARSGRVMPLRHMVRDGYYPTLMVDPAWYDPPHPLEQIKDVHDPVALARPAPRRERINATVRFPGYDVATGARGAALFEAFNAADRHDTPLRGRRFQVALFTQRPVPIYDGVGEVVSPGYTPGGRALRVVDYERGLSFSDSHWADISVACAWLLVYETATRAPLLRVHLGAIHEARHGNFTIDWNNVRVVPDTNGTGITVGIV